MESGATKLQLITPTIARTYLCIKLQTFSEPCKPEYTCYVEECSSGTGPDILLQELGEAKFAYQKRGIENQLNLLKCPTDQSDEEIQFQTRFCCRDFRKHLRKYYRVKQNLGKQVLRI